MSIEPDILKGVVRNGVIEFQAPYLLPDGTEVEFVVTQHVFTAEEQAEFEFWDKLSDEAFQMVLDLEQEKEDAHR